ncbi:MAG: XRE family transcriptional regulator [Alphaproteobacteria bacterium]|nr:XRE family transcriptional regulator [Alphaproteobacteria bacterium]
MEEIIFPNQIRMIRRTRGKTMKEIASILGVSLSAISKIEKGYRRIDEQQLTKISAFLNCPKESIFVFEQTSQPEVLQAWEKEQERRKQINEKSGLKTLGAGFRYLRGGKMLTLQDVAKGAGLTLSVYHRIEMGQREVTEEQFQKIAHALGFDPEELQMKIYELDMAGSLQEFKKTGKPGIFHPKGGYNDLPLRDISFQSTAIDFYDLDNAQKPVVSMTPALPVAKDCFAITANKDIMDGICKNSTLLVSSTLSSEEGQLTIIKNNNGFEVGFLRKDADGFVLENKNKKIKVNTLADCKKVVCVLY